MNITLNIDRLILEDMDLSPRQRRQLQGEIEAELTQLLTIQGLPSHWQQGGAIAQLPIHLPPDASPHSSPMSQQIAHAIYQGMIPNSTSTTSR